MNEVKKNFIYNLMYQILVLIIPLITTPYLARIIGASGIGVYSYTYSIAYYFMLLTLLGVNNYGNRSIAKVCENKHNLSKTFWSIYFFQFIMGIVMSGAYLCIVWVCNPSNSEIFLLQLFFIISAIFDINWFFFGIEEFKITIGRNIIVRIGSLILILLFVKRSEDLWKYTVIMSGMALLGQLSLWLTLGKHVHIVKIKKEKILQHIRPNLTLFVPVLAVSIYKMMDKIMLGMMSTMTEVGYYENAEKIVNIPIMFMTALSNVMLPRISNLLSKGENEKTNMYMDSSIEFILFLIFPMMMGLLCVAQDFVSVFFGTEFLKSGILIKLLSITLPVIAVANIIRTQYLIPHELDRIYIVSVSIGAGINIIMNMIFIPRFQSIGACFGTIASEILVMVYQTAKIRNIIVFKQYLKKILPFLEKSIIMFFVLECFRFLDIKPLLRIMMQIVAGSFLYGILNNVYIKSLIKK